MCRNLFQLPENPCKALCLFLPLPLPSCGSSSSKISGNLFVYRRLKLEFFPHPQLDPGFNGIPWFLKQGFLVLKKLKGGLMVAGKSNRCFQPSMGNAQPLQSRALFLGSPGVTEWRLNLRVEVLQKDENIQNFSIKHTTAMDRSSGEPGGGTKMGNSCTRWDKSVRMREGMEGKAKIFVASISTGFVVWANFLFLHFQSDLTQQGWLTFHLAVFPHQILQTSVAGWNWGKNSLSNLPFLFLSWILLVLRTLANLHGWLELRGEFPVQAPIPLPQVDLSGVENSGAPLIRAERTGMWSKGASHSGWDQGKQRIKNNPEDCFWCNNKFLKGVLCNNNQWGWWWWERHHSSGHSQLVEAVMDSCGLDMFRRTLSLSHHKMCPRWTNEILISPFCGCSCCAFLLTPSNSFQSDHNPWGFLLFSISSWGTSTLCPSSRANPQLLETPEDELCDFLMGCCTRNAREIF